jgi:phage baseplate assembly protein W
LLLTNRGERIMQPDFGANLKPILTEFGTVGFESEVMSRIKASVSKFFPYISLSQMSLQQEDSPPDSGLVIVSVGITYSIPQVNATNQSVQVTLNTVA